MIEDQVDVIVIGGGAAGLEAASQLERKGRRVVLLEGRNRLGGRIWTEQAKAWGGPIELGAEFIHGGNRVLKALMKSGGLKKRNVDEQHWLFDGRTRKKIPDAWERIDRVMKHIGPRFGNSFGEWLRQHGEEIPVADRTLAETFVRGFQGAPLDQMSAHTLFEATKHEEEQARIRGGYIQLIGALEKRIQTDRVQLHLDTLVKEIKWTRGGVKVSAGRREWRAKVVLITVPLGVLRAGKNEIGAIRFDPSVPAKERHWRKIEVGHAMRVVLRMKSDIWQRGVIPKEMRARSGRAFGFLHSEEEYFPVWWTEAPRPVLVGWTGGPAVKSLASFSSDKIFRCARRTLAKALQCDEAVLAKSILDWRTHNWATDPLTRGAYSFSVAGEEGAPTKMAQPVAGVLFFAGEATADPLELGTVHGALASGARAAKEINEVLGRRG